MRPQILARNLPRTLYQTINQLRELRALESIIRSEYNGTNSTTSRHQVGKSTYAISVRAYNMAFCMGFQLQLADLASLLIDCVIPTLWPSSGANPENESRGRSSIRDLISVKAHGTISEPDCQFRCRRKDLTILPYETLLNACAVEHHV